MPLDILYVGTLPPHPGGSAILAGQVLEGFVASGHAVRAISPVAAGLESAPAPKGVDLTRFAMPWFEMSPDQPASEQYREAEGRGIRRLFLPMAEAARPDVVIIGREIFVWHVAELAGAQALPSVLWVQGGTTWGMRNGSLPESMTRKILAEIGKVDRVVAVAHHVLGPLQELGIDGAEAIPNGVDLDRFRPGPPRPDTLAELGIPDDGVVVLHASNMKELKRPRDLVRAAGIVSETDPSVTWVMVGDGPVLGDLKALCREMDLEDRFRFVGWVDHADMPDLLRAADVVVMPSAAEALALVYLETQACGRVLVASDIPAAREVVTDGENGLLFPVGDAERLAEHLLRLAADPELRTRIGDRARERVHAHSMRGAVAGHIRVLEDLVAGPSPR